MTGHEVKTIREALGDALGRNVSQRDLGLALGLAPANAKDTVRSWEDGSRDVTGPAATALKFFALSIDESGPPDVAIEAGSKQCFGLDQDLRDDTARNVFRAMMGEIVKAAFERR
jgi:hypothetical protein